MAYSDDAVRAKLASLNETQDSIVSNAQWIMFHRRHADRTAALWLERLQSLPMPKRLNLVYLANEVVQQSRARGKQDFLLAFEPIIAEATALAYKGANHDVQNRIRRVVEVWRQRTIFDARILDTVEGRLTEIDRGAQGKSGKKLGGSLFGGGSSAGGGAGGVPLELESVAKSQAALTKAEVTVGPATENARKEHARLTDPNAPSPSPPVYAARLSALLKNLATAQGAVDAGIKARKELLAGLEKLVETNRAKLAAEEQSAADLATKRDEIEAKKKDVEDSIMRGLSASNTPEATPDVTAADDRTNGDAANGHAEPAAPEAEGFTPPPPDVESFTPAPAEDGIDLGAPNGPEAASDTGSVQPNPTGAESIQQQPPNFNEPVPTFAPPPILETGPPLTSHSPPAFLSQDRIRQASAEIPGTSDPRPKRRKMSHSEPSADIDSDIFGAGANGSGVDEDGVAALLNAGPR